MIRITNGAYGRIARLECDVCGVELPRGIALLDTEAPNAGLRSNLREQGQRAGWTGLLRGSGDWRDLCPDCFTMPPEA
jgi:hypothetical protein